MLNSPDLITRLTGQALDRAVPETWTTLSLTQLQRFQQAFAELIVAECCQYLDNEAERLYSLKNEDGDLLAEKCYDNIAGLKTHFGFKE